MACPPFEYDDYGRRPIGVNQQQGGDDYPLVNPSADVEQLLADVCFSYRDDAGALARPFHITWLHGFGCETGVGSPPITPTHAQDLVIKDANDATVFDTSTATGFLAETWSDRMAVYTWTKGDMILVVTAFTTWRDSDETPKNFPEYFAPTSAVLDDRVLWQAPRQLTSIRVGNGGTKIRNRSLRLAGGYNTTLSSSGPQAQESGRQQTTVTLEFVPGSGLGRYGADCSEPVATPIYAINSVSSDHGNFQLDTDGCLRVQQPILESEAYEVTIRAASLAIDTSCDEPCCSCDDYINVYEAERRLTERVRDLITRIEAARAKYIANVTQFLETKRCAARSATRVIMDTDCPTEVVVIVGYCNQTPECMRYIYFDMLMSSDAPGVEVGDLVCDSTYRAGNVPLALSSPVPAQRQPKQTKYTLGGTAPQYTALFEQINAGTMGYVSWRIDFPDAPPGTKVELSVQPYRLNGPPVFDEEGELVNIAEELTEDPVVATVILDYPTDNSSAPVCCG